ncbi:hypothetical protein [Mastigocladopsis repens]|uniref:hypothetical protein n=1 Tax=Mastigocladopsis repens TaxID=221287 RepID=UPI0003691F5F|nr:hypothetical protein [Mastigocladopsis repens]
MLILTRLPFISLALLLLTYTTVGWVISKAHTHWFIWLLVVSAILVLVGGLTISFIKLADYSLSLFKSNLRSFGISLLAALLFFLMIAKFRIFVDTLVIVAATLLAKIDFQTSGFSPGKIFWFLSIFSLTGLALGALIYKLI